jgi:hypothetical protein
MEDLIKQYSELLGVDLAADDESDKRAVYFALRRKVVDIMFGQQLGKAKGKKTKRDYESIRGECTKAFEGQFGSYDKESKVIDYKRPYDEMFNLACQLFNVRTLDEIKDIDEKAQREVEKRVLRAKSRDFKNNVDF